MFLTVKKYFKNKFNDRTNRYITENERKSDTVNLNVDGLMTVINGIDFDKVTLLKERREIAVHTVTLPKCYSYDSLHEYMKISMMSQNAIISRITKFISKVDLMIPFKGLIGYVCDDFAE